LCVSRDFVRLSPVEFSVTEEEAISLVARLVCENQRLDPAQISAGTNLVDDLGLDSLDAAELLVALHQETGRQLELGSLQDFQTVRDVALRLLPSSELIEVRGQG
jgi:acyl carrier protein